MNRAEYLRLGAHLKEIADYIPLKWGKIQNDKDDALVNIFTKDTFDDLNNSIVHLANAKQNYLRRRWFLWQCSKCDEYLFYSQQKVIKNPNYKDQNWDIELLGHKLLRFDVKSTILPNKFRSESGNLPSSQDLVQFYFDKQSKGIRNHFQNRIFLVHLPYTLESSNVLRTKFEDKQKGITEFIYDLSQGELHFLIEERNHLNGLIYFKEDKNGQISYKY